MDKQDLIKRYKEFVDTIVIDNEDIDHSILNHHVRLLELIARVENSSLTIFDLYQKKYIFVRNRLKELLLYDEEKAADFGFMYFFSIMHPDDLPKVLDTNREAMQFLFSVTPSERADYKLISEFRLRNQLGEYIRFIQQVAVLELDRKGNVWLVLMLHDVSPNQTNSKTFQRSMLNIRNNKAYLFQTENSDKKSNLSKREIEILGLLAKGMMSKEIANQLFISVNTVNNHRQNIIEKMDVENTAEALTYAKKIGIV